MPSITGDNSFLCTKCTMSITRHSLITYIPQDLIQLVPNHSSSTVLTFVQLQLLLLIFKLVISVQLFLTNARICKCDYLYLYRVTSRFMPHHPGPDLVIPNCNNLPRDSISINKDFGWCAWGSVNILCNNFILTPMSTHNTISQRRNALLSQFPDQDLYFIIY